MHANQVSSEGDGEASGVLSTIVGISPFAADVRQIEQILGIDRDFPAALNLVEKLLATLQALPNKSTSAQGWTQALESVQEAGKLRKHDLLWTRVAATSRAGNPLGGKFTLYPLPAFLLQEPLHGVGEQANLIHRLFLEVLLKQNSSNGTQGAAIELRKLIASSSPRTSMGLLPTDVSADWSAWEVFLETLPENDELAKLLIKLMASLRLAKSAKAGQSHPGSVITQTDSQPTFPTSGDGIGGEIPSHRTMVTEPGDPQTAEPPKYVDLHVALPEETEAEPASEREIESLSREIRQWISRQHRITPNDPGRLTPIERRWLASRLNELMVCEDKSLSLGAGIVALMYVTGMSLDTLLQVTVGPDGIFDGAGEYRRVMRLPKNAYNPPPDVADHFLPREVTLSLQLPEVVASWTRSNIPSRTCTFAEAIGVEMPKAKENVDDVMKLLRDNGHYTRIRRERIPAALTIELNLRHRDLALVHHLASGSDHVPPVIAYYVVHFIEELKRHYREVTEEMLPAR